MGVGSAGRAGWAWTGNRVVLVFWSLDLGISLITSLSPLRITKLPPKQLTAAVETAVGPVASHKEERTITGEPVTCPHCFTVQRHWASLYFGSGGAGERRK